jgi:hypothetical protein
VIPAPSWEITLLPGNYGRSHSRKLMQHNDIFIR